MLSSPFSAGGRAVYERSVIGQLRRRQHFRRWQDARSGVFARISDASLIPRLRYGQTGRSRRLFHLHVVTIAGLCVSSIETLFLVHTTSHEAPQTLTSYHGWGLVIKYPMQNFRPLELQEPLLGSPWSFHRNLWQRQNLHNRNTDSNANSMQTSTSP